MTLPEAIETTRIHRVAGLTGARTALVTTRPCRAPHHTISDVGLIGGGQVPMPGEVSLAHHGVLFLDELPERRRHGLEVLRQPLERGIAGIPFPVRHRLRHADHDRYAGRAPTGSRRTSSSPAQRLSATAYLGGEIPVDKPAQYPYSRANRLFFGSSYLCLRLAAMRGACR
jgi:hypothetical protein